MVLVKTKGQADTSPRVPNKMHPGQGTDPRVPIKKLFVPHQLGTIIYKQLNNKHYQGKIVQHNAHEKLYKTLYVDGDEEELSHEEVIKYTKAPIETTATQFQRIKHEYWTAKQSGR